MFLNTKIRKIWAYTLFQTLPDYMKVIKRMSYKEPQCSVICIKTESLLKDASGNAGSINSGQSGGDAKQNNIWDDMEEKS